MAGIFIDRLRVFLSFQSLDEGQFVTKEREYKHMKRKTLKS